MPAKKITFIGAGSLGFTAGLVRDILTFPAFEDAELCLMDIDAERLKMAERSVRHVVEAGKYPATIITNPRQSGRIEWCRWGFMHNIVRRCFRMETRHRNTKEIRR